MNAMTRATPMRSNSLSRFAAGSSKIPAAPKPTSMTPTHGSNGYEKKIENDPTS